MLHVFCMYPMQKKCKLKDPFTKNFGILNTNDTLIWVRGAQTLTFCIQFWPCSLLLFLLLTMGILAHNSRVICFNYWGRITLCDMYDKMLMNEFFYEPTKYYYCKGWMVWVRNCALSYSPYSQGKKEPNQMNQTLNSSKHKFKRR